MASIIGFIKNIKNKNGAKEVVSTEVKDVAYLIECVNNFASQMAAVEECKFLLQYLSQLPKSTPITDDMIDAFKTIIKNIIDKDMAYKEFYFSRTPFQEAASIFNSYATTHKEEDGSYSISAVTDNRELTEFVQDFFMDNRQESIVDVISKRNKAKEENLLRSKINTYYGDQRFILDRTKAIIEAIKMIKENYQLSPMEFQLIEIKLVEAEDCAERIYSVGNEILIYDRFGSHITNLTQDEYLTVMSPAFQELVRIESELAFISDRIWKEYFEQKNAKFVHALSGKIVHSDQMPKICSSLYLDDLATIPYGHVGYEYGVSMDNIDCICECDAGSWVLKKSAFVESGIRHSWQYDENTCIWYEYGYFSKLLPPHYIEQMSRTNNKGKEILSYTEILILNKTKKIAPIKAFCTDLATQSEIDAITQVAAEQGIEVEYIDTKAIKKKMDNAKMA